MTYPLPFIIVLTCTADATIGSVVFAYLYKA